MRRPDELSYRESENLKRRGRASLELAEYSLSRGFHDMAVFHAHQAIELFVKGVLLKLVGTYPRTHDLMELLDDWLSEKCDLISKLLDERGERIDHLTDAYFSSRYSERSFRRELASSFIELAREVLRVASLCEEEDREG